VKRITLKRNEARVTDQAELVALLDAFFKVSAFNERGNLEHFPPGYESTFKRFAAPAFVDGTWNGLMLDNATTIDRVYLIVLPGQSVLDTIIGREVERGASGALIFGHHMADYQESGSGDVFIAEAQMEDLREHHISFYVCHSPLDCHPEISTAVAFANGLKVREQQRFASFMGGLAGVYGKVGPVNFHDFTRKVATVTDLPALRYSAIRHNGRPVQQVGIVTGTGGSPEHIREAMSLGCDTFVTGEWWPSGPDEEHAQRREEMHAFLVGADVNLIGTSSYASEAVVMRDLLPGWLRENTPSIEPVFIPQDDPWH
jgi:putative NIF3 family GTP cyclohydrolase 1 type 2